MDMSGMGGMSMDMGTNLFKTTNMALARAFWYIVAGLVGAMAGARAVNFYSARWRLRRAATPSVTFPSKTEGPFLSTWATLKAVVREASYPQLYIPNRWLTFLSPPSAGRLLVLLLYTVLIIAFSCSGAIVSDAYFYERIAFRAAWLTVTQLPLMYLLASKNSVLTLLTGISYERFNWLHRWVGRGMFATASVHGWHFYTEWAKADFVELEIRTMPMVKWGLGAWGVLAFTLLMSSWPVRRWSYEGFVAQHVVSTVLLLWVVWVHVPTYAQYNVWFAVAALCFDRAGRGLMLVWQNVKVRTQRGCAGEKRVGHDAEVKAVGENVTLVTVRDVHFRWRPGQHVYLNILRLGPTETHPYTISCAHKAADSAGCACNSVELVVRKHGGFSARIHKFAAKRQAEGKSTSVTAFVTGPYGNPPRFDIYETLILIAASTGASFTLPILESVVHQAREGTTSCVRRVYFLVTAKKGEEIEFYVERLQGVMEMARGTGLEVHVSVCITGNGVRAKRVSGASVFSHALASPLTVWPGSEGRGSSRGRRSREKGKEMAVDVEKTAPVGRVESSESSSGSELNGRTADIHHSTARPDVEAFIRGPVEATGGETSVVVCGGPSLVSRVRNCVARLSDERAVHKGTGAQGIGLHVEEYCF